MNWPDEYDIPLSVDKTITLYSGHRQPVHDYIIHRATILTIGSVVSFKDLGVQRTAVRYSSHCDNLVADASQVADAIGVVLFTTNHVN